MPSLDTVVAARAAAGADYAAKADSLIAAYIELTALDQAVENSQVGGTRQLSFAGTVLTVPVHAEFYPNAARCTGPFGDRIRARLESILRR